MAREIDWSQPLSEEDRAWAMQRDMASQVEENDRQFGNAEASASQDRAARMDELRGLIASHTNELARLEQEQVDEDNTNRALAGDPATGNVIRDNTGVNGEAPEGATDGPEDYSGDEWTNSKLQAEIKRRNEERVSEGLEPISVRGSKSELIERLQADDAELAESAE